MEAQARISEAKQKQKIGKTLKVLIDDITTEDIIARSSADAPEIDGVVHLPFDASLKVGDMVSVKVKEADCYDLWEKKSRTR